MKPSKQSQLIHIWEDYEFYLNLPKNFKGSNKPFVYFYYFDTKTNKSKRIRKYVGKNGGNIKSIKEAAKDIIKDLVAMLGDNWNPVTDQKNETTVNLSSTIMECVDFWISKREEALQNEAIGKKALKNNKIVMMHFSSYLGKVNLQHIKASSITNIHIKEFLDSKAFERNWGKVTYNTYFGDMGNFFNYLKASKVITDSPCDKVNKKNVRSDSTRFKIFEKDELLKVSSLLFSDKRYFGLHVATKLLTVKKEDNSLINKAIYSFSNRELFDSYLESIKSLSEAKVVNIEKLADGSTRIVYEVKGVAFFLGTHPISNTRYNDNGVYTTYSVAMFYIN